jgi:hypothetical protein
LKKLALTAVLLTLPGCQVVKPTGSVRVDPELEAFIPADTVFITGADVAAIRDTAVYQKYLSAASLPQLEEFIQRTGLDPRKDLRRILSCSNGSTALFMARGGFKLADLEPRLKANGAQPFVYQGRTLFGDQQRALVFMNNSTAIAGSTAELRAIIDHRDKNKRGLPPALKQKIDAIPAGVQVWAALIGGVPGINLGVPRDSNLGNLLQVFRGVESATLGIDLRNGFGVHAGVDCRSDNDARHVHDALKGIIGLGRLSTPDNQPELLKLYDAIEVNQQQTAVRIEAQIAPAQVDQFVNLWLRKR